jgi:hypothetical protein
LPGSYVATIAGCRSRSECVVVAHVAGNAGRRRGKVQSRQRKPRCRVVKYPTGPNRSRVAEGAVLWERCRDVIRDVGSERRGALPGDGVAIVAGRCSECIVVAHMAGNAGRARRNVRPCQGKPCRAVIERRRRPTYRCMARAAIRHGKNRRRQGMWGICGLLPSCRMAS